MEIPVPSKRRERLRQISGALLGLLVGLLLVAIAATAYDYLAAPSPRAAALPLRLLLVTGFLLGPLWWLWPRFGGARRPAAATFALAASLALFGGWLVRDETEFAHDTGHSLLPSDFPEAAVTHGLVLRYSKNVPGSLLDTLPTTDLVFPPLSTQQPEHRPAWLAFLTDNRDAIQHRWEQLAPLRAWYDELAAAPALADLTADIADPIPAFQPLRAVSQASAAQASILALDGRRDEAVALLLPVLAAGQKLEVHARTVVRRMLAIVIQRNALAALSFVLDQGPLEDATRQRLAVALHPHHDPAEGARLLILAEYPVSARVIRSMAPLALAAPPAEAEPARPHLVGALLFNPVATGNALGDHFHALAAAAARRDFPAMDALSERLSAPTQRFVVKNYAGRRIVAMITPAFAKVAESYWLAHDERAALLARL